MMRDSGLDTLLDLDGSIIDQGNGFWVKIDARLVKVTDHRPHGIKYALTLHEPSGSRVMGFDNAHAVRLYRGGKYVGRRVVYDHKHRSANDEGTTYEFSSAYQLLEDFWKAVDEMLAKLRSEEN